MDTAQKLRRVARLSLLRVKTLDYAHFGSICGKVRDFLSRHNEGVGQIRIDGNITERVFLLIKAQDVPAYGKSVLDGRRMLFGSGKNEVRLLASFVCGPKTEKIKYSFTYIVFLVSRRWNHSCEGMHIDL